MSTDQSKRKGALLSVVALAAGLAVMGVLAAGCGGSSNQEPTQGATVSGSLVDTIIVSGTGKVTTLPDKARIQVSVENDGITAAEALDANSKDTQKVLDRLKAEGVADNKIETTGVVVYPNRYYDSQSGQEKTTGYRAQNTVSVIFDDLAVIGEVIAAVTEAGADSVYGPSWELSEDNAAVTTALTKAIANARTKAEAIATDQGVKLGDAIIISESSASSIYPIYDARAEQAAGMADSVTPPPISPQNMEVTATVTVTYRMTR